MYLFSYRFLFFTLLLFLSAFLQMHCGTLTKVTKKEKAMPHITVNKTENLSKRYLDSKIANILYKKEKKMLFYDTNLHRPEYIDTAFIRKYYAYLTQNFSDTIQKIPLIATDSLRSFRRFIGATNFGIRKANFIIIHHTAQDSVNQTFRTFSNPNTEVSAHYLIGKDGVLYPLVNDYLRAWHAGISKWGNVEDINSVSIGIELDNNGQDTFPSVQIETLLHLLSFLKTKYNIPTANFIGHADIAPDRKTDPNVHFPWKLLAENGFGLWYDDTTKITKIPKNFDPVQALRIIGYSVNPLYPAIIAFRRHFTGIENKEKELSKNEKKILFSLFKKYM